MRQINVSIVEVEPGIFDFSIPEDLYKKLEKAAISKGLTVSAFVSKSLLPTRLIGT